MTFFGRKLAEAKSMRIAEAAGILIEQQQTI